MKLGSGIIGAMKRKGHVAGGMSKHLGSTSTERSMRNRKPTLYQAAQDVSREASRFLAGRKDVTL